MFILTDTHCSETHCSETHCSDSDRQRRPFNWSGLWKRIGSGLWGIPGLLLTAAVLASGQDFPAPGAFVNVNQNQVHLHCTGNGSPVVVLESGLGGNSVEWSPVQERLANKVRVCSYDRPGYGWSDLVSTPRNALTIARELEELLENSDEQGPYVLVGHSFGGHIIRLFANEFGTKVAGMVLVDASHENMFSVLSDNKFNMLVTIRVPSNFKPRVPPSLPEKLRPTFLHLASNKNAMITVQNETYYFRRSSEEVKWHPELPAVPITVISRGTEQTSADAKATLVATQWSALQKDLYLRLATAEHVIARRSGHFPHLDQPGLVADAILNTVAAASVDSP